MVLVNSLNTQVADDMRKGRIYGEGRGNASFDLPGGAIIRVSGGGNGLHMILNSADEEQRMLRKKGQLWRGLGQRPRTERVPGESDRSVRFQSIA